MPSSSLLPGSRSSRRPRIPRNRASPRVSRRHKPAGSGPARAGPAAADLPRRHQLRPRRRASSPTRTAIRSSDLKPEDFEVSEQGQAAGDRDVQADLARRRADVVSLAATAPDPHRRRRGERKRRATTCGCSRFSWTTTTCGSRPSIQAREQLAALRRDAARALRHGRPDVTRSSRSPPVRMTRNHEAVIKAVQQFRGRKYDYTPRNEFEEQYAYYPAEPVERIRNQVSMSAIKSLDHPHGRAEGRAQGADPPERGLHQHAAAADARSGRSGTWARQPDPGRSGRRRQQPAGGSRGASAANMSIDSDLRDVYDAANKNNVAIYAVDPRGLPTAEFGIDQNIGMQHRSHVPDHDAGDPADARDQTRTAARS